MHGSSDKKLMTAIMMVAGARKIQPAALCFATRDMPLFWNSQELLLSNLLSLYIRQGTACSPLLRIYLFISECSFQILLCHLECQCILCFLKSVFLSCSVYDINNSCVYALSCLIVIWSLCELRNMRRVLYNCWEDRLVIEELAWLVVNIRFSSCR